jgi:exodeoxyribonuclease V alpha subunit
MIELEGIIDRITYYNEDTYYTVAKLKLKSGKLATIVGNLPPLYLGETLAVKGEWGQHKEFGEQFQVEEWHSQEPTTLVGVERFLGSGLLKGIGPSTAKKIVKEFGLATLETIQNTPEKLAQIPGISLSKADRIANSLHEHAEVQQIMIFLQGVGISPGYALKIYRTYKNEAVKVVKENPYRLADEVHGIGFKIADQIAQKLGIQKESPYRIRAGIRYLLSENSNEGHLFAYENEFLTRAQKDLEITELQLAAEIEDLIVRKELYRETVEGKNVFYLAPFYYSEVGVVARMKSIVEIGLPPITLNVDHLLQKYSSENNITLATQQREAVLKALDNGMLVITGGPGTGKTTIIKAILYLFKAAKLNVMLAAPTGRAAKRLSEATGEPAKTIHRLLGYGAEEFEGSRFQFNEDEPLETDVLIIDEFSMVDLMLFYNLLKAVTPGTRLIIVGDVDQLPSVGPGTVLQDLIQSGRIPVVRLNVIFRQAQQSLIVSNAHKINQGEFPFLSTDNDFFFIEDANPEHIAQTIPELVKVRIPAYLKCDPVEDIQVLTPMRRTVTGIENLNLTLQEALNPPNPGAAELKNANITFRVGDKVMQLKNDYQKLVFNGDIGRIRRIDPEDRSMVVGFPEPEGERKVPYEPEELDQLVLSYAISVHKSQGNEYPVVIMPVTTQHFLMLQRNLLYTAVTRAKKMVVLIGTKKAIAIAVKNNKIEERHSLLKERIRRAV